MSEPATPVADPDKPVLVPVRFVKDNPYLQAWAGELRGYTQEEATALIAAGYAEAYVPAPQQ